MESFLDTEDTTIHVCKLIDELDLHLTSKIKAAYVILGTLSIIAAVLVFTTIFADFTASYFPNSNKKSRAHSSIMIGYISIFEAIS